MIFDVPFLIEYFSSFMTLQPGDLILTGTPDGVVDCQPGDVIVTRSRASAPSSTPLPPKPIYACPFTTSSTARPCRRAYFETINPATQQVLAEVASGGEAEVHAAVAAAKAAFPKWAGMPAPNAPN
jgi:hypothetical protein